MSLKSGLAGYITPSVQEDHTKTVFALLNVFSKESLLIGGGMHVGIEDVSFPKTT